MTAPTPRDVLAISGRTMQHEGWHRSRKSFADGEPPHAEPWASRAELSVIWADVDRTTPVAVNDYDGCWAALTRREPLDVEVLARAMDVDWSPAWDEQRVEDPDGLPQWTGGWDTAKLAALIVDEYARLEAER